MESANVRPQKIYKIDKLYSAIPIPKYSGSIGIAGSSRTRGTVLKVYLWPEKKREERKKHGDWSMAPWRIESMGLHKVCPCIQSESMPIPQ